MSQLSRLLLQVAEAILPIVAKVFRLSMDDARQKADYRALIDDRPGLTTDESDNWIADAITKGDPCLVARLGGTECRLILRHHMRHQRNWLDKTYAVAKHHELPFWLPWQDRQIRNLSGFYPVTRPSVKRFIEESFDDMADIDLLGSWVEGENHLIHALQPSTLTTLGNLSPIGNPRTWTRALKGKRVLVIHPFAKTIEDQYQKRTLLFEDPNFLPEFALVTIPAVQSLRYAPPEFETWFDALDSMTDKALAQEFDIAIIGAGAYGLPLGARIKRHGKVAIVLGGVLQLLFGIKGARWDSSGLYNDHWVRPRSDETPQSFRKVEGGAYW